MQWWANTKWNWGQEMAGSIQRRAEWLLAGYPGMNQLFMTI